MTTGNRRASPTPLREFAAAGIKVSVVPVRTTEAFEYSWIGKPHYLAYHDLHLTDGDTFADDDGGTLAVRRKDLRATMTFVPSGCRVWGWSQPRSTGQSFTAMYLDARQMEEEVAQRLHHVPSQPLVYFGNAALRSTLEKIRDALKEAIAGDSLYLESLCLLAVVELCVMQREKLRAVARPPGRLAPSSEQRVADYVEANLDQPIGLDDLARIAGLSRFHFLRSFKKTTNETPYQYLLQRRLERAESLLRNAELSVAEIAAAVGFKDTTRFIRAFRLGKGVTPGKFRS